MYKRFPLEVENFGVGVVRPPALKKIFTTGSFDVLFYFNSVKIINIDKVSK